MRYTICLTRPAWSHFEMADKQRCIARAHARHALHGSFVLYSTEKLDEIRVRIFCCVGFVLERLFSRTAPERMLASKSLFKQKLSMRAERKI